MLWLKRNMLFLVGCLVALGLIGFGTVFLLSNLKEETSVTEQLQGQTDSLKNLMERDPHPGTDKVDNIGAAKKEQARLQEFLKQSQKHFVPPASPAKLDSATFKGLLENTIFELTRDAENAGVTLPAKYGFTFQAERPLVQFAAGSLEPLAAELADIKAICKIVFDAKVHSLTRIRRVPVSSDDPAGSLDYLPKQIANIPSLNAQVVPYELSFQGFSSELAEVLSGFNKSPHCIIVKSMTAQSLESVVAQFDPTGVPGVEATMAQRYGLPPTPAPAPRSGGMDPAMMKRYGLSPGGGAGGAQPGQDAAMRNRYGLGGGGNRYGGQRPGVVPPPPPPVFNPGAAAPAPMPVPKGPSVILDEKALQITMSLEVVKIMPPAAPAAPAKK